jgi:hypothetical protein
MIYKILEDQIMGRLIVRIDEDGIPTWLGLREEDPGYLEWVKQGNVAETWVANELQ